MTSYLNRLSPLQGYFFFNHNVAGNNRVSSVESEWKKFQNGIRISSICTANCPSRFNAFLHAGTFIELGSCAGLDVGQRTTIIYHCSTVIYLRIYVNSSVRMSKPKMDYFPSNLYILILNNFTESFNKFFISLSINQLTDKISTWLTQVIKCSIFLKTKDEIYNRSQ